MFTFYYIRVKNRIMDYYEEEGFDYEMWLRLRQEFVPDADMPEFPAEPPSADNRYTLVQIPLDSYPKVLSRMTAREAAEWGISRCRWAGWKPTPSNIRSVLSQYEMEL